MSGCSFPTRPGDRPVVSGPEPHEQVTQTAPPQWQEMLVRLASALPGVEVRASYVDVAGTRAFHLSPSLARGPREAFLAATEFAHIHPSYDGSIHLTLPPHLASRVEEAGWGEWHPEGGPFLVYGPRNAQESELVWKLLRMSYRYALGEPDPTVG
jgi:phospholipase/carboxylesterase